MYLVAYGCCAQKIAGSECWVSLLGLVCGLTIVVYRLLSLTRHSCARPSSTRCVPTTLPSHTALIFCLSECTILPPRVLLVVLKAHRLYVIFALTSAHTWSHVFSVALFPFMIFSLFHVLTFTRTGLMAQFLPPGPPATAGGPPTPHPLAKKLQTWTKGAPRASIYSCFTSDFILAGVSQLTSSRR